MAPCGGKPREPSAEAEPNREDGSRLGFAEKCGGGGDVVLYAGLGCLGDVVHVRKGVVALVDACRPAEVVDGDGSYPTLGEAECELLVEAVEASDVWKDHDPDAGRPVGHRGKGGEAVSVGRLEHEILVPD